MRKGQSYTVRPIRVVGDLAYVTLTKGYEAVVDAADVPLVAGRNWYAQVSPKAVYAARSEIVDGRQRCVLMHRAIAAAPDGLDVDHRDRDGINNRRKNLRVATRQQNQANRAANANCASGIKGVRDIGSGFTAEIEAAGGRYYLGKFDSAAEAAAAYQGAARVLFGEFARVA